MKTRYFLDSTGGWKVSGNLTRSQYEYLCGDFLKKGMREVTREEWYAFKKKHSDNSSWGSETE